MNAGHVATEGAGSGSAANVSSARDDLLTAVFGVWMIVGLFTDGWAHLNLPGLETFFTPWHGLLYSGFAAGAAWLAVLALRGRRTALPWARALPPGYGLAAVGVVLFGAGGVGDMVWHIVFGVEIGIDALLSPTHLVLLTGASLMLTAPLRAIWRRPVTGGRSTLRGELPAVLALALVTALASFFLLYVSVFTNPAAAAGELTRIPERAPGHEAAELPAIAGLAGYLVTTVLLVAPLLLAERLGRRPRGATALVVGMVAWLSVVVGGFTPLGIAMASAVTAAAGVVDFVIHTIDQTSLARTTKLAVSAAALPVLIWPAQLAAVAVTEGVRWPVELWSGVVVLSALVAAALATISAWAPAGRDTERIVTRPRTADVASV
ncbi:hypothetical protein [Pseudonocardia sp. GCM10023141]|uniref:hypothetical protein n=1 Tax=Pseudonocardia sp. GCM10023141 TaxID=3252653 RepID=UPI0036084C17